MKLARGIRNLGLALVLACGMTIGEPSPVSADIGYCGGYYGITVYEGFNYLTPSRTFCSNTLYAVNIPNLADYGWNNRISSIKTRNSPGGQHRMHMYDWTSYGGVFVAVYGNVDISNMQTDPRITRYLTNGCNNRVSSMRTRID